MDFAVLVKVVPAVEQLRFDATTHSLIRTGVELFLNPYDGRAVRVAVQLRRPGERVTVLSMGPPETATRLQETYALGADRVILVSDEALAGSDSLVTARALRAALGRVGHDLLLAGERSVDSETGQVGPQLAGLLGVPVFTSARGLVRSEDGNLLQAVVETGTSWDRIRFPAPAVVTVNERILRKAPPPSPEARLGAESMAVETLRLADLGLLPSAVGFAGSPTRVVAVDSDEPDRRPRVFGEGTVDARVEGASQAVEALLGRPPAPVPAFPPIRAHRSEDAEVVVLASGADGRLEPSSLGVISEIRRRAPALWPSALWAGPAPPASERYEAGRSGALQGYHVRHGSGRFGTRWVAEAAARLLAARPHVTGLALLSTPFGREVAGQLSALCGLGLTGDAVGLDVKPGPSIVWRKPAFGGGWIAAIGSRTRPSLATVRPGSLARGIDPTAGPVPLQAITAEEGGEPSELVERSPVAHPALWGDLTGARTVLIVGMGLGGPDSLAGLEPTLRSWRAALGATRKVVDAGWLPAAQQVGLTGTSLSADLAVLVGVSGSGNHLIGLRRTRVLLAINPDASAPVFQRVDVGIVGSWSEVLPRLTERLAAVARSRSSGPV